MGEGNFRPPQNPHPLTYRQKFVASDYVIDIQAMWWWVISPFSWFLQFWSIAINTMDKLQFVVLISIQYVLLRFACFPNFGRQFHVVSWYRNLNTDLVKQIWCFVVEAGSGWINGNNGLLRSSSSTELRALQDQVCTLCEWLDFCVSQNQSFISTRDTDILHLCLWS